MSGNVMKRPKGEMIDFTRPDGLQAKAYKASPLVLEGAPAIVVIQEWWGLNTQIMGIADRFAECGYLVLVPDLYRGESTVEEEEAHHLMGHLDFNGAISQDIQGAVNYLKNYSSKIGVTGYCMGGALTLLALSGIAEFSAGVAWYGFPPLEALDISNISVPLIGHWATQDIFFNLNKVELLESKMRDAGVNAQFYRYLAHHAFANETAIGEGRIPGTQYDAFWAQQAWDRTLTFFGKTLW